MAPYITEDGYGFQASILDAWNKQGLIFGYIFDGAFRPDEGSELKLKAILASSGVDADRLLGLTPTYTSYSNESIASFAISHDYIDKMLWLARISYLDKEVLRNKNHDLLELSEKVIGFLNSDVSKQRRSRATLILRDRSVHYIQKAWLDELSYSRESPSSYWTLSLGKGSINDWQNRDPQWAIIKFYYSCYYFLQHLTSLASDFNSAQHKGGYNRLRGGVLSKLAGHTILHPFCYAKDPSQGLNDWRKYGPVLEKWQSNQYAAYVRDKRSSRESVEFQVDKLMGNNAYFFDALYEFRCWANYTGVDSLQKLYGGPLVKFTYRNMQALMFLLAIQAEIAFIHVAGEAVYLDSLKQTISSHQLHSAVSSERASYSPPALRARMYKKLGIIVELPDWIKVRWYDPVNRIDAVYG